MVGYELWSVKVRVRVRVRFIFRVRVRVRVGQGLRPGLGEDFSHIRVSL
jgi:hypothetical protein